MNTLDREDFDEYIHEMCSWPIEKIVDTVADDLDLRDYLAACAGNYRNGSDFDEWNARPENQRKDKDFDFYHFWETTQFLVSWTWKDYVKFSEEADRKSIAHWAPYILRALDQRMRSYHSQQVKKELEQKKKDLEKKKNQEKLAEFYSRVPKLYKNASIHDFSNKAWKGVIDGVQKGNSYLIFGGNGIGKTHFGYAMSMKWMEEGERTDFRKLVTILASVSAFASASKKSGIDIIDEYLVRSIPHLIIDEADKAKMDETSFRNFSYLIDRRYEEQLQTIVLCNADNMEDLRNKLGSSICDRFLSKKWNAEIKDFSNATSRRESGSEKPIQEETNAD